MSKKVLKGQVVSNKMQKTIVVAVDMVKRHRIYDKVVSKTKKLKAHDEIGTKEGDVVIIQESRPYSKSVTWEVVEVVESEEGK